MKRKLISGKIIYQQHGGCSVMLPILHFWMGFPTPIAIGTTLFAVIFTAISGGYDYLIRKNLDKKATLWLSGFGIMGVVFGSWLFIILISHVSFLGLILGLAFLLPAIRMIWEGFARGKNFNRKGILSPVRNFVWEFLALLSAF